jgi:hypothetical protein
MAVYLHPDPRLGDPRGPLGDQRLNGRGTWRCTVMKFGDTQSGDAKVGDTEYLWRVGNFDQRYPLSGAGPRNEGGDVDRAVFPWA